MRGKTERRRIRLKKAIRTAINRSSNEEKIKKAQKEGLRTADLLNILAGVPNFLGVFASDQLVNLKIYKYPVFLISNLDISSGPGNHWIAIRISRMTIEIFDSLGFNQNLWGYYPEHLFFFLDRYKNTHRIVTSPIFQSQFTFDCELYSCFFIFYRHYFSFQKCCGFFSRKLRHNHLLLLKFFLQ